MVISDWRTDPVPISESLIHFVYKNARAANMHNFINQKVSNTINMSLKIQDFGPIEKADVMLNNFTIIIGKNNVGKSYLTQLFKALYEPMKFNAVTINDRIYGINRHFRRRPSYFPYYEISWGARRGLHFFRTKITEDFIVDVRKKLRNKRVTNKTIIDTILRYFNKSLPKFLKNSIMASISQTYGMELKNLVCLNKNKSIIDYKYNEYNTMHIEISNKGKLSLRFRSSKVQMNNLERDSTKIINETRNLKRLTKQRIMLFIMKFYQLILYMPLIDSIYIPAGRAGLLEGYDTIVSILIELASVAPMYGISMPQIQGLASQFYNMLFSIRGQKGPYNDIAKDMVNILGGNITIQRPKGIPRGSGRFLYTFKKDGKSRSIPVIQAASMIKELTPIYLIINEIVYPNSLMIIEEPESHLHPDAQCNLANILTQLISRESKIIVTTHSDIFVRQIGNLISAHKFSKKKDDIKLNPEILSLYLIKDSKTGSISKKVPIPENGIFENIPEFDDVINQLYNEQLKYQQLAQREG